MKQQQICSWRSIIWCHIPETGESSEEVVDGSSVSPMSDSAVLLSFYPCLCCLTLIAALQKKGCGTWKKSSTCAFSLVPPFGIFFFSLCLKLSTFNSQLHSPFLRLLPHALNCLPLTHSSTHHFSVSSHLAHTVWAVSHRLLTPCPHCVSSIPQTSQILPTLCERYPTDFQPFPHYVSGIPQTTHPAHTMWVVSHRLPTLSTLCEWYPTDYSPYPHYVSGIPQTSHPTHTMWVVSHRLPTQPTLCEWYPTDFPPNPHYVSGIPQTSHPTHTMWVVSHPTHTMWVVSHRLPTLPTLCEWYPTQPTLCEWYPTDFPPYPHYVSGIPPYPHYVSGIPQTSHPTHTMWVVSHRLPTLPTLCEQHPSGLRYRNKTDSSSGKPWGSAQGSHDAASLHHEYKASPWLQIDEHHSLCPQCGSGIPAGSDTGAGASPQEASRTVHPQRSHHAACLCPRNYTSPQPFTGEQYSLCPQCGSGIPAASNTAASVSLSVASRRVGHQISLQSAYLQQPTQCQISLQSAYLQRSTQCQISLQSAYLQQSTQCHISPQSAYLQRST